MTIWRSLGSDFLTRNWKSMWKPYAVSILYFLGKIFLFVIFQTLFTTNQPFFTNFGPNWLLVQSLVGKIKICPEVNLLLNFDHFLPIPYCGLTKNKLCSKLSKNGRFSVNKVWKMTNKFFFPIKYKMLTACGFHIDFQFRGQKSLSRDLNGQKPLKCTNFTI